MNLRKYSQLVKLTLGMSLLLAVAVALAGTQAAQAKRVDDVPPTFAGLRSATTCIPGPIGGDRTSSYTLQWDPASDNVTPSRRIVYDIYQAEASGGQDFSSPTYTSDPGATSFMTPMLPANQTFYFVVRARDRAGNSDDNKVERQGVNLCV
jgi:hypothetical protein